MTVKAVLFDVYRTLFEVGPAPTDSQERWERLWREDFKTPPRLSMAGFTQAFQTVVAREHEGAKKMGIPWPEVFWPELVMEILPELKMLRTSRRNDVLFDLPHFYQTVSLKSEAVKTLIWLRERDVLMGIVSNAQDYTVRELSLEFQKANLPRSLFQPDLCFWSFENGFSKPDPHVFRILTFRLKALGIAPAETIMVGDRLDNDIEPAHAQGFQGWHLADVTGNGQGDWIQFRSWMEDSGLAKNS